MLEDFLRTAYAGQRRVRLQLGSDFPFELQPTVGRLFDTVQGWQLSPEHFAGAQLLGEISAASSGERASSWGQTDPATGKCYLKLPVPDPQTIQRLAEGLLGLLGGRKWRYADEPVHVAIHRIAAPAGTWPSVWPAVIRPARSALMLLKRPLSAVT